MAQKIPEAQARMTKNVFVCQKCQTKMKADPQKILKGLVKCRKKDCRGRSFRILKKK
jgi:hypothetical protein